MLNHLNKHLQNNKAICFSCAEHMAAAALFTWICSSFFGSGCVLFQLNCFKTFVCVQLDLNRKCKIHSRSFENIANSKRLKTLTWKCSHSQLNKRNRASQSRCPTVTSVGHLEGCFERKPLIEEARRDLLMVC